MDKGNGIINLRAIGFRKFSEDTGSQWLIEATERGLGAEAFQTPVLDAKIAEFSLMSRDGEPPVMLMRSLNQPTMEAAI